MVKRLLQTTLALVMVTTGAVVATVATTGTAQADECYTWDRTLSPGASGADVTELQTRVAGYPGNGNVLAIDGEYGPSTEAAVQRFQSAYGLGADGIADPATFDKIYELQSADCSPAHFNFSELNTCNSDWSGGKVSAAQAKENAKRTMWKLEAMRKAMGDQPIRVTSGFRSVSCNNAVGGSPDSRHLYGDSADLGVSPHSLCALAKAARDHGFNGILGPGYPGHDDHTHVDHRDSRLWSAPTCGI